MLYPRSRIRDVNQYQSEIDPRHPSHLVNSMVESGKNVAKLGLIGFFPACYLGVAAMTVASAGTILVAGFVGGMAIYFARNMLKILLQNCMPMSDKSSLYVQLQDMGSIMLAGVAGAWLLGLAIYPVVACVALGMLTLGLVKLSLDFAGTRHNIGDCVNYMDIGVVLEKPLSTQACELPQLFAGF